MPNSLEIRPIVAADETIWRSLWHGYLTYYEATLDDTVYASTFARLLSDDMTEPRGLLAMDGEKAIGLVHYIFGRTCWKVERMTYLQDLFTTPDARGKGVARALISAVYAKADLAGASAVWWLTQEFNYRGRMLYDQVGVKTPFIRYNRPS